MVSDLVQFQRCQSDRQLKLTEWVLCLEEGGSLIGLAADWLELDSPSDGIRFDSEIVSTFHTFPLISCPGSIPPCLVVWLLILAPPLVAPSQALRQEIQYASYLSLTTIILPPPKPENKDYLADYARAINTALAASWHIKVSSPPSRAGYPTF